MERRTVYLVSFVSHAGKTSYALFFCYCCNTTPLCASLVEGDHYFKCSPIFFSYLISVFEIAFLLCVKWVKVLVIGRGWR